MFSHLKAIYIRILFDLGADICCSCGSDDIIHKGFAGFNERIYCHDCKREFRVK
jgi:hypothetical protein